MIADCRLQIAELRCCNLRSYNLQSTIAEVMPALTDAQQRIAELTTLNELAQTLNRALDLREALDTALPHIVELMGLRTGWMFLRDEAGAFRLAARHDLPPAISLPRPGLVGRMQLPGAVPVAASSTKPSIWCAAAGSSTPWATSARWRSTPRCRCAAMPRCSAF